MSWLTMFLPQRSSEMHGWMPKLSPSPSRANFPTRQLGSMVALSRAVLVCAAMPSHGSWRMGLAHGHLTTGSLPRYADCAALHMSLQHYRLQAALRLSHPAAGVASMERHVKSGWVSHGLASSQVTRRAHPSMRRPTERLRPATLPTGTVFRSRLCRAGRCAHSRRRALPLARCLHCCT